MITPCTYKIQPFTYEPKKKGKNAKSIEEQRQELYDEVIQTLEKVDKDHTKYPQFLVQEFIDKYTEVSINQKLILWNWLKKQKAKKGVKASIGGTLGTFRTKSMQWHPEKWKVQQTRYEKPTRYNPHQQIEGVNYGKFKTFNG